MTEYVSLGSTCAVSNYLIEKNLRKNSYPFDWCNINIKQLNETLYNDFDNFTNIKFIKFGDNYPMLINNKLTNTGSSVFKNNIGIKFAHEIFDIYGIQEFKEKQLNRIIRFKNIDNPQFIRYEEGTMKSYYNDELEKLLQYLDNNFTNYNFTLLVPSTFNIIIKKNINIFKYNTPYTDWKNIDIFNILNI